MSDPFSGGTIAGNILPDVTGRNHGSPTQQWNEFVNNLTLYGTLTGGSISSIIIADPSQYATLQAAVTAASTTGAVIIPPNYTASDSYTNPNNIVILDFRPTKAQQFVFEGDSITAGTGLTAGQDWPSQAMLLPFFKSQGTKNNFATSGNKIADLQARYTGSVHPLRPTSSTSYPKSYLFVLVGINDVTNGTAAATIFSNISTYWTGAKTDGFTLVALTQYRTTTMTAAQCASLDTLNNLIRTSSTWDYLIDLDQMLTGLSTDANFFQGDFVHPTAVGAKLIARAANGCVTAQSAYPLMVKGYNLAPGSGQLVGIGTQAPFKTLQTDFSSTSTAVLSNECQILANNPSNTVNTFSGVGFANSNVSTTLPIGRVVVQATATGSKMHLQTCNNYGTGVTSSGVTIDKDGNVGILTTSPTVVLDVTGAIKGSSTFSVPQIITPRSNVAVVNGANADVNIGGSTFIKLTGPTGVFSISGFTGGVDGRELVVYNSVAFAWTITNNATSTAANRILTLTGADVVLRAGQSAARFQYDSVQSLWVLISQNG